MANLWNPLYLPYGSLTNWYDSTDTTTLTLSTNDTVANWRDKSYKANNLSETDFADLPLYGTTNINGLSTVDFDGGNAINLDDEIIPINGNMYMMYVGFNNTFNAASTMFNFNGASLDDSLIIRTTQSDRTQLFLKDTTGNIGNINITQDLQNQAAVYTIGISGLKTTLEVNYLSGGNPSLSGIIEPMPRPLPPLNKLTLGAQNINQPDDINGLNGQVGEFIVFTFSDSDEVVTYKQKLEGYTAWKWGLVGGLPGDHPYKTAAPTVTDVEFRNKLYETSTEEGSSRFRRLFALGYVG